MHLSEQHCRRDGGLLGVLEVLKQVLLGGSVPLIGGIWERGTAEWGELVVWACPLDSFHITAIEYVQVQSRK